MEQFWTQFWFTYTFVGVLLGLVAARETYTKGGLPLAVVQFCLTVPLWWIVAIIWFVGKIRGENGYES